MILLATAGKKLKLITDNGSSYVSSDLADWLDAQNEAQVVLAAAPGARRGAGVQGLRFGQRRPCPLDPAYRLRRSDHAAKRTAAREHRNPHARVFLTNSRHSGARPESRAI